MYNHKLNLFNKNLNTKVNTRNKSIKCVAIAPDFDY